MPREYRPRDDARTRLYNSAAWKRARAGVLERDGWLCVLCKRPANTVHHIRAVADGGEPLDETNLATLCHTCHGAVDGRRAHAPKEKRNRFMTRVTR